MFVWGVMSLAALARWCGGNPLADVAQKAAARSRRVHVSGVGHRLAVGPADVGHLLGMGCAADLGADPVLMYLGLIRAVARGGGSGRAPRGRQPSSRGRAINLPIIKFCVDLVEHAAISRLGDAESAALRSTRIPDTAAGDGDRIFFSFVTLHLAAMRNEILRRRVRSLQMMQASQQAA